MESFGSGPTAPIGVVLAGGAGRRLGGAKATVPLGGRPLVAYPLAALRAVLCHVVVQAKPDTALPDLGVPVWIEPLEPRHPLFALVEALERAAPRAVLVCAADLPFVTASLIERLAAAGASAPATVAAHDGRLHPLVGVYQHAALAGLRAALRRDPDTSLTAAVLAIPAATVEVIGERTLFNVNTLADLRQAEAWLSRT